MNRVAKIFLMTCFLIITLLFSFIVFPVYADSQDYVADEVLVKTRAMSIPDRLKFHREVNTTLSDNITSLNIDILKVESGKVMQTVDRLKKDPRVIYAEPNYKAYVSELTNDPAILNNLQWGLYKVRAADTGISAWNLRNSSNPVIIAIVDTGIDQNHEDLQGKIISSKNCSSSPTVDDLVGHGTHVAGIAAASTNNGLGVAGLGYETKLINAKGLGDDGSGSYAGIVQCITFAADNGAGVINMSLGGSSSSKTLEEAINYAVNRGVVLIAAAGNAGNSNPSYPAYYQNVISVAATDSNDQRPTWSNYGDWVDVAAPGVSIYSTLPNHSNNTKKLNYGYLSGTSMATPFVSGLAALLLSSGADSNKVTQIIGENSDRISGTGINWVYGRINALRSISSLNQPTPTILIISVTPTVISTNTPAPTVTSTPAPSPVKNPRSKLCNRFAWLCQK